MALSNFLDPSKVADAVAGKINSNLANLKYGSKGITKAVRVSTVPKSAEIKGIKPPWCGVFYSLAGKAEINEAGTIDSLQTTIGILICGSPGYDDDVKGLDECIRYAMELEDIITGEYDINIGTSLSPDMRMVYLRMKEEPYEVLVVDPDMTLVTVSFEYPYQK